MVTLIMSSMVVNESSWGNLAGLPPSKEGESPRTLGSIGSIAREGGGAYVIF